MDADESFMIGALLNIPTIALRSRAFEALRRAGFGDVTPSLQPVMMLITPDGSRVTTLAVKAGMTKQSMGYLVAQLEMLGYVERVPDPNDRRAQLVKRTRRGWGYNRTVTVEVTRIEKDWTELIGKNRMSQLKRLLAALTESLGVRYEGSATQVARRLIREQMRRTPDLRSSRRASERPPGTGRDRTQA